ncbi:MAG TPA: hypothetical protein VGJ44_15035 [Kribbellaceae bacterium]
MPATGINVAHGPADVVRVPGRRAEPHLRAHAIEAAAKAPVEIEVLDGTAERLPRRSASSGGS